MIAFFGTGLLGAGFVQALLKKGEAVHVWNRTASKAQALVSLGAKAFEDPAEAARGASRIHLTLSDDASVDEVLERARAGFASGVAIIDHTTTSPEGTKARAQRWDERKVTFLHAPVFMGPAQARDSTGSMLASGEKKRFDALAPALESMTGKLIYLGPQAERAAAFKLLGNLFLMFLTGGFADMLRLAKATGVSPQEAASLFDFFNPGAHVPARMKRMLEQDYAHPSWTLDMARKDARLMVDAASAGGAALQFLPAIAANMDAWVKQGHGQDDWTVVAKDALT
jgi:3-hydroxyisobutyrate dehydrogenase